MSRQIVYLSDYEEEANLRRSSFGKTDKYSTGLPGLDKYLGYGFGNRHGYEIVTVFGESGVGKSAFVLNMVAHEMVQGTRMGLMALEDDMPDVYNRIRQIVGQDGVQSVKSAGNVDVLPPEMLEKSWQFDDILRWINGKYTQRGIELFIIDHINFVFDNADQIKGENELVRQRKFMQQLNFLCKRHKLTVILVSHTAKAEREGMDKIFGTTAIKQVSTKIISVESGEGTQMVIRMHKSRFTMRQEGVWKLNRIGLKLEEFDYQPIDIGISTKKGGKK